MSVVVVVMVVVGGDGGVVRVVGEGNCSYKMMQFIRFVR